MTVIEEPFERVLPKVTDANRYFWQSGADGRLQVMRCGGCGHWMHPPTPVCPQCWSTDVAPQPVSGRGTVFTFTINRYQWVPGFEPPYIVASIEFAEQAGLRFLSNVIDCSFEEIRCGLDVEVVFAKHDEVYLPLFRPVRQGGAV